MEQLKAGRKFKFIQPECLVTHNRSDYRYLAEYLADIGQYRLLTDTEQLEHSKLVRTWLDYKEINGTDPPKGVVSAGKVALYTLWTSNLRLVVNVAKKNRPLHVDLLDVIQEGNIGLHRGLCKFDPTRGYKISTYVVWWIRQAIMRSCMAKYNTISLPISVQEKLYEIKKIINTYSAQHGEAPSIEYIANEAKLKVKRTKEILEDATMLQCSSLDYVIESENSKGSYTLLDYCLEDKSQDNSGNELTEDICYQFNLKSLDLQSALAELPFKESYVVEELYYKNKPVKEIAEALNVTPPRIAQLLKQALKRLKEKLTKTE